MADEQLYPVFNIPTLVTAEDDTEKAFKPGPLFDYDKGDFVRDGANRVVMVEGRDAYILWCLKTLKTSWARVMGIPVSGSIPRIASISRHGRQYRLRLSARSQRRCLQIHVPQRYSILSLNGRLTH